MRSYKSPCQLVSVGCMNNKSLSSAGQTGIFDAPLLGFFGSSSEFVRTREEVQYESEDGIAGFPSRGSAVGIEISDSSGFRSGFGHFPLETRPKQGWTTTRLRELGSELVQQRCVFDRHMACERSGSRPQTESNTTLLRKQVYSHFADESQMNRAQGNSRNTKTCYQRASHLGAVWQRFHREAAAGTPLCIRQEFHVGQTLEGLKRSVNGVRPVHFDEHHKWGIYCSIFNSESPSVVCKDIFQLLVEVNISIWTCAL